MADEPKTQRAGAALTGKGTLTASGSVERVASEIRLAVFSIILSIGIGVGVNAGFAERSLLCGFAWFLGAVIGTVVVLALVFKFRRPTQATLALMDWILRPLKKEP